MAYMHQVPESGFTCYWKIKDFGITSSSPSCSYQSEVFRIPMLNSSLWHLELNHDSRDSLGLYLHKEHDNWGNSNLDIQMSVLTSSGWRTRFCDFFKFKPGGAGKGTSELIDWRRRFSRKNHVLDDCLTVSCHVSNGATWDQYEQCLLISSVSIFGTLSHSEILEFNDLEPKHIESFPSDFTVFNSVSVIAKITDSVLKVKEELFANRKKPDVPKKSETKSTQTESTEEYYFSKDLDVLLKLFKDERFQYVTLHTASKDFAVHKALLCVKSPVFNAMLQNKEKKNGSITINIDDLDIDTLSLFLQFLHLESIPIDNLTREDVVKLYYAAKKYQVEPLEKECRSFLKENSTNENVFDAQAVGENIGEKREAITYGSWCF